MEDRPDDPDAPVLASRLRRLAAAMIDNALVGFCILGIFGVLGVLGVGLELPDLVDPDLRTTAQTTAVGYFVWLGLNARPLQGRAQTLGKMALGVVIVDESHSPAPLLRIAVDRTLSVQLVSLIPYIGVVLVIADVLFIFRADRRCLHDHLARTHVVDRAWLLARPALAAAPAAPPVAASIA